MAKSTTFQCSVITPERSVLECETTSVVFPAHDGELGVLVNRSALLCRVGIGVMRIQQASGSQSLFVDGGFAQIVDNRLTILTEQSKKPEELNSQDAEQALVEARAMDMVEDGAFTARQKAVERAKVQIRLSRIK